jgi:aspartate kinase
VDDESYRQAATFLADRLRSSSGDRFIVVVSARKGATDELERLANAIVRYPNPRILDLLWCTAELRSVALLTLHLEELGIAAAGLNVHETGLRCNESAQRQGRVQSFSSQLRRSLEHHSIVVVPGFFGTLTNGSIVSLGRGGSDLTAVLLANELEAERCELIKDVAGYFTEDPGTTSQAEHLPWISYDSAIEMASRGCELVQRVALEAARENALQLVVRGFGDALPGTVVSMLANQEQSCER